jgi:hypothetical protein
MPSVPAASSVPVTVDNFIRAESDLYFGRVVRDDGFGQLHHLRELSPIDHQVVVRLNRDTLYSSAVFDLEASPATISLPDSGSRFMSLQVISEDHYTTQVSYNAGDYTLTREKVGTRYALIGIRTLVDPNDLLDVQKVHALQDAIRAPQSVRGSFDVPRWDLTSQTRIREALTVLGTTVPDSKRMFGTKDQVDPIRHLIGSAIAWGGNPVTEATYLNVTPKQNDGRTIYKLTVHDVPVDGFWSVTVYNSKGYFEFNKQNAYSINNLTARKSADGSVTIQFGGCNGATANCLPITKGWNYTVRLYRPRPEVVNGKWRFPDPQLATEATVTPIRGVA